MARLALAAVAALLWQAAQTAPPPARTITIDFVALDRSERPVTDLKPGDVDVRIGQFRTPVETLRLITPETDERGGRLIVLLLDDMTLRPEVTGRVRDAARRFVTTLSADDSMSIVTLTGRSTEATRSHATLLRFIDGFTVRASPVMRTDQLGRHLLETLAKISERLVGAPATRKTIVGIGPGWLDRPLPPPIQGQDLQPEWIHAMRQMAFSRVNYYTIDPGGVGTGQVDSGEIGFARETGGRAFHNTNDLAGAADRILRESATYYIVEVPDPPVGGKADLRALNVTSLRKGVTLRARHAIPGSF